MRMLAPQRPQQPPAVPVSLVRGERRFSDIDVERARLQRPPLKSADREGAHADNDDPLREVTAPPRGGVAVRSSTASLRSRTSSPTALAQHEGYHRREADQADHDDCNKQHAHHPTAQPSSRARIPRPRAAGITVFPTVRAWPPPRNDLPLGPIDSLSGRRPVAYPTAPHATFPSGRQTRLPPPGRPGRFLPVTDPPPTCPARTPYFVGYARVSTTAQDHALQIEALKAANASASFRRSAPVSPLMVGRSSTPLWSVIREVCVTTDSQSDRARLISRRRL